MLRFIIVYLRKIYSTEFLLYSCFAIEPAYSVSAGLLLIHLVPGIIAPPLNLENILSFENLFTPSESAANQPLVSIYLA